MTESVGIVFAPDGSLRFQDLPFSLTQLASEFGWRPACQDTDMPALPRFWLARSTYLDFTRNELETLPMAQLWDLHSAAPEAGDVRDNAATLLDLKTLLAQRLLANCVLCELRCGADRLGGQHGPCGSGHISHVSRAFLNLGEERRVSPGFCVFFTGCNWHCPFCQYPDELNARYGRPINPAEWAAAAADAASEGARTLHFLGGNPDQHLAAALEILQHCGIRLEVVWNSNGYASEETMRLLNGIVDVWLTDLRFGNEDCAVRLGAWPDTWATVTRNLRMAAASGSDLIIRHLQLPGHFTCCTAPCLRWIADNLAACPNVQVNLMAGQYMPLHRAYRYPALNRFLDPEESKAAVDLARDLALPLVE